jgi:hydroxymethylpyrimidine/phosphomethylpyrimidine kinase
MSVAKALTIAGSDSGGGAGIQADLKTFSAFEVFGMSAITAVTAQNSVGVLGVLDLPPDFVGRQIDAVLDDIGADAIKTGMLATKDVVGTVAGRLRAHRSVPLVVDPVMIATSGDPLLQPAARDVLVRELLPLATLVTPNLMEAGVLADMAVHTEDDMVEAARRIAGLGPRHVLVKGGHLKDSATDVLWDGRTLTRFAAARVDGPPLHGSGCTYSAAIAAGLARGGALIDAITEAKAYVTAAIRGAIQAGRGAAALRHFAGTR